MCPAGRVQDDNGCYSCQCNTAPTTNACPGGVWPGAIDCPDMLQPSCAAGLFYTNPCHDEACGFEGDAITDSRDGRTCPSGVGSTERPQECRGDPERPQPCGRLACANPYVPDGCRCAVCPERPTDVTHRTQPTDGTRTRPTSPRTMPTQPTGETRTRPTGPRTVGFPGETCAEASQSCPIPRCMRAPDGCSQATALPLVVSPDGMQCCPCATCVYQNTTTRGNCDGLPSRPRACGGVDPVTGGTRPRTRPTGETCTRTTGPRTMPTRPTDGTRTRPENPRTRPAPRYTTVDVVDEITTAVPTIPADLADDTELSDARQQLLDAREELARVTAAYNALVAAANLQNATDVDPQQWQQIQNLADAMRNNQTAVDASAEAYSAAVGGASRNRGGGDGESEDGGSDTLVVVLVSLLIVCLIVALAGFMILRNKSGMRNDQRMGALNPTYQTGGNQMVVSNAVYDQATPANGIDADSEI